jgi:ribonuclease P protein subunit RPR2
MKFRKQAEKKRQESVASERIERLIALAGEEARNGNTTQADILVSLARRISTKTKSRIPAELKKRYCKHCHSYLIPGKTSKTRINSREKRVEATCLKCKGKMYHQIKKR